MKTRLPMIIALFTCLLTSFVSQAAGNQPNVSSDEAAIRKVVQMLQDGWNARDGKAFAAPFAEDADYVVINGMYVKGRVAIAEGHQGIFDTIYKESQVTLTVKDIRFLRPDIAIAHTQGYLKFKQGGQWQTKEGINTLVLTKEKGNWNIAAFQNTAIAK